MRTRFAALGVMLGLALSMASLTQAAEMPPLDALQAQMGAATATVYEPHLSVGDAHTAVEYVGYPAVDVLAHLFGADWAEQARRSSSARWTATSSAFRSSAS